MTEEVCIVSPSTDQGIVAAETRQNIIAGIAGEDVVEVVAGSAAVGRSRENQVFDAVTQCKADAAENSIDAGVGVLHDGIARVVNDIGVVAGTTHKGVGAETAIENVIAVVAGQDIVKDIAGTFEVAGTIEN